MATAPFRPAALGSLGILPVSGESMKIAEVVELDVSSDLGWGEGGGSTSWDDGEKAQTAAEVGATNHMHFWENSTTSLSGEISQGWWDEGDKQQGQQQESTAVLDFPPGSPSACLPDETYGADYVDEGFLERELEIFGQKLTVTVAYTAAGVERWLDQWASGETMFGFDLEWEPNRRKGDDNPVALLQLSLASRCLIVQLLHIDRIPAALVTLLADANVKLGGVGVRQDVKKLEEDHGLRSQGEVDLAQLAVRKGWTNGGLAALSQSVLRITYVKNRRLTCSNWAVEGLSFRQIQYAASDAWLSYALLVTLTSIQLEQAEDHGQSSGARRAQDVAQVAAFLKDREIIRQRICQEQNSSPQEPIAESTTNGSVMDLNSSLRFLST